MANRVSNTITLTGDLAELERFQELAHSADSPFSMNNFVPVPKELPKYTPNQPLDEAAVITRYHGQPNSLQWKMEHWGTAKDADTAGMEDHGDSLTYRFITAWTPFSENAMSAIAAMFPALDIRMDFDEPLKGITGWLEAKGGTVTGHVFRQYTEEETAAMWGEPVKA